MNKKRTDLSALVKKYQKFKLAEKIEISLNSISTILLPIDQLYLSDLFSEDNYRIDLYDTLQQSIAKDGFLVPLVVNKEGDKYEILNGVKRFLIAKKLNLKEIPVVKASDLKGERKYTYILENIQYEHDCVLVKTYAFSILKNKYNYNLNDLSKMSSLSISQVRNILRLDKLPSYIKDSIKAFEISYSEARTLLNLDEKTQRKFYDQIMESDYSVRDLEKRKRKEKGKNKDCKVELVDNVIILTFNKSEDAKKYYPKFSKEFDD